MGERGGRLACVEDLVRQPGLVLRDHAQVLRHDLPVPARLVPLRHQAVHHPDACEGARHRERADHLRLLLGGRAAVLRRHLLAGEEVEALLLRGGRTADAAGRRAAADQLPGLHHPAACVLLPLLRLCAPLASRSRALCAWSRALCLEQSSLWRSSSHAHGTVENMSTMPLPGTSCEARPPRVLEGCSGNGAVDGSTAAEALRGSAFGQLHLLFTQGCAPSRFSAPLF